MYNVMCMFKHTSLNAADITSVPLPELEARHQGRDEGFLAVILNMGIIQLKDLKDYWSKHYTTILSFFRSIFPRDRFFQIFGDLYVGDPDSPTKKGKIQPFIDCLCAAFEAAHTPDTSPWMSL